jgi:tRNA 2-thiouridine synthesizing protein E
MATVNPMLIETPLMLSDLEDWSEERALLLAGEMGIEMSAAHWDVVYFLREQCDRNEGVCNARKVIRVLQERFSEQGGKRYLYSLFPGGPVRQASHIAGLPMPPDTLDLSFGSVH